jgi:tetratricopeptide (TPR) repeat protein
VKMARIWSRTTQKEQAISKLEEVISKFPNYAPAYKDLVELYIIQGKYSKVTPLLQKYVQLAGTDLPARKRYVKYLAFQAKDYENTITEANKVLSEDPKDYTMYRWMGWAYAERKQYQDAYDALTKYFEGLKPTGINASVTEYVYFATAAANLGKFDEAAATYMRIAELDSTRTDVYDLVGKMYFDNKMYDKAAVAYEQKIAKGLAKTADYVALGRAYNSLKDYPKADSAFAKVNELSPTYAYAYDMRARIANNIDTAGTLFLAKPHYEKIIELSNTDEKFKTDKTHKGYLANAYAYMGAYTFNATQNAAEALVLIEKALAIDPENTLAKYYKDQLAKAAISNGKGGNRE